MAQPYRKNNFSGVPLLPALEDPGSDYVASVETYMDNYMKSQSRKITTSKLRNFLSLVMDVYNTEILRTEETICPDSVTKLQRARIRMVYECGRDQVTKVFVDQFGLLKQMKEINGSRSKAIRYAHFLEAIVAYHCFFGGKEN